MSTDLDKMLADISAAWEASRTPPALQQTWITWSRENAEHLQNLRATVGGNMAWWIIKGEELGHSRDTLDQAALQAGQMVIAQIALAMKRRQGEPFSPARVAIVAYAMAEMVAAEPGPGLDLDAIAKAADELSESSGEAAA